ncbi:MAG TPA: hypothetical protein VGG03_01950 [Thermoanaerobaculia bacterium]|jgi:hypothetical protein
MALLDFSRSLEETRELEKAAPAWGAAKRLLFRFVFAYLVLYIFPFPLSVIPGVGIVLQPYEKLWNWLVPWVGKHVFRVDITVLPNGSGDTTYNWVQVFCFLILAGVATLVWTLLDRSRTDYARFHQWLRVYVRFWLATVMISYGAAKVIPTQFPSPALDRLLQPIGDSSPMGILWTFMGASAAYTIFSGAAEMLGGLLLIARRTTLLGALVCIGVLTNVVVLNFCYDVPVKLYSCHLLAAAVFLAAPDLRRLADLLVFNRRVEPVEHRPLFKRPWLHRGSLALRTVFVVGFAVLSLYETQQLRKTHLDAPLKPPLSGLWNVDEFAVDGRVRPPLVTDETRWRRVVFRAPETMAVLLMDDSRQRYVFAFDEKKSTVALTKRDDPKWKSAFSLQQTEPGLLALEGTLDGRRIRARLRRVEAPEFRLVSRGFHWINEYPYNR